MTRHHRFAALLAVFVLAVAACGADEGEPDAEIDQGPTSTTTGAVSSMDDVESAVFRIETEGNYVEPGDSLDTYEEFEAVGTGSGFIIDPSGIAVTNSHVVAGAATIRAFVAGDTEPVDAKVLGTSECNDLAVIDLEGDGYPFLDWYQDPVETGLEIRAAGYPLGDPEFTLTSGIVSKAEADGATSWAAIDSVFEHDANIQEGNSGGPIITADTAQVVGVQYRSDTNETGPQQFLAIAAEEASGLADRLEDGHVESLGVNGNAVVDEEAGVRGVWVNSVRTGSPAADLGLQGGDIIERLEGITLGVDGTLADYCRVVRSHDADDELAVQVLRFADQVRLEGSFNGTPLAEKESLAAVVEDQTGELADSETVYTDFVEVSDDSDTVSVEVPVEWDDLNGAPRTLEDGTDVPSILAAPDIAEYDEFWDAPGVEVLALGPEYEPDDEALLDQLTETAAGSCVDAGREPYEDALYVGLIQYYRNCGEAEDSEAAVVGISAGPEDGSFTVLVYVQLATDADLAALQQIIDTFVVRL